MCVNPLFLAAMTMSKVCFAVICSVLLVVPSRQALAFSPCSHCPTTTFLRQSTVSHYLCRKSTRLSLSQIDKETRDALDEIRSACTATQDVTVDESHGSAGLPSWLQDLEEETFYTCRPSNNKAFSMERLSQEPPIYLLRNFLSRQECDSIREQVSLDEMQEPQTLNGQGSTARPNCKVAWLDTMDELAQDVADCMLDPLSEYGGQWVENLQVLKYSRGGEYVLHHDGHCRLLTCLYNLNGVGGTWFPFADSGQTPSSRDEAVSQDLDPTRDGVVLGGTNGVPIEAGDAVVFYNYQWTPSGGATEDWRTLHAGLPTTDTKWIANHWFHIGET